MNDETTEASRDSLLERAVKAESALRSVRALAEEMLKEMLCDCQRALNAAGGEIVKLRLALGLNPMHCEEPANVE